MNRRVCVCVGLIVWYGLLAEAAFGQISTAAEPLPPSAPSIAPADAGIATNIKTMIDVRPFRPQIQEFIKGQIDKLTSDDPAVQKATRDKLIAECSPGSSSSYLDVYAQEIDAAALALLSRNPMPRLRVRLNLAVMVEAIAHNARTDRLKQSVIVLVNDPADVVAFWGMRAAKPTLLVILQNGAVNPVAFNPGNDKLMLAILPAVKKHYKAGYVATEAYKALIPSDLPPGFTASQMAGLLPPVFAPMLDILDFRVSLYGHGIPDTPSAEAESGVARFLNTNYAGTPALQQRRIVQALMNLVCVIGQQAQNANRAQLDQLSLTLEYATQALVLIADNNPPPGTQPINLGALNGLIRIVPGTPGTHIYQLTKPVYDILKVQFPFLQPPPTVTPTSAPATIPGA